MEKVNLRSNLGEGAEGEHAKGLFPEVYLMSGTGKETEAGETMGTVVIWTSNVLQCLIC